MSKKPLRIVLIGGGSYAWTPKIATDIMLEPALAGSELILHDIDLAAQEELAAYCRLAAERTDTGVRVKTESDLKRAVQGADFVLLTISTGGLDAMAYDIEIPAQYGVMQSVGDTVGPGGLIRSLRNIPVIVDIAQTVESVAPKAWFLNYTNPMSTLTRAICATTALNTVGLCHELFGLLDKVASILGVDRKSMVAEVAGINHLSWVFELRAEGRDLMSEMKAYWQTHKGQMLQLDGEEVAREPFKDRMVLKLMLMEIYGCLATAGDRHVAEFFPYFLSEEAHHGLDYGVGLTTIAQRRQNLAKAQERVRHVISNPADMPLSPSNEAASNIIASIAEGRETIHILNLPNKGQIDNLPREAIVETMGVVGPNGAKGITFGEIPEGVASILRRHLENQEMTVEAAFTGNRNLALQVLINDPLMHGCSLSDANKMLDELLQAHAALLPQF
mgnify:FL=1